MGQSDDGEDFSFMYVRDGTIFTLEKPQLRQEEGPVNKEKESINYGYLALLVFDSQHWKHIKAMNVFHTMMIIIIVVIIITICLVDIIFIILKIIDHTIGINCNLLGFIGILRDSLKIFNICLIRCRTSIRMLRWMMIYFHS